MSRATALAYDLPATAPVQTRPDRPARIGCHILGTNEHNTRGAGTASYSVARPARRPGYLELVGADPFVPYEAPAQDGTPLAKPRLVNVRPLVGMAAVALLLLLVASPAFAMHSSARKSLILSGYTGPSAPPVPQPQPAPVIDLSTAPQPAPQPAPAPADPPKPALPATDHTLVAPPSISVRQIDAVLQQYGSPAVGTGQALYDLGVRYGIDPAYALAFFVHESGCGTKGVARFTKSLGNIRWTESYDSYEGYRAYSSWEAGMEDWYKLITDLYINGWNLRTVDAITPVYAPWGDNNNPDSYADSVKSLVDSWRGK